MAKSFGTSRQHTELLRSRPSSHLRYDLEALKVFVEWAEASQVPRSAEISLLLNSNGLPQMCMRRHVWWMLIL